MNGDFLNLENLLNFLQQRTNENWLVGYDVEEIYELTKKFFLQFSQLKNKQEFIIFLVEENPDKFIAVFLAAIASKCHIFLGNPHWQKAEWQQVFDLIDPDLIIGKIPDKIIQKTNIRPSFLLSPFSLIILSTGGSTGKIRFAIHTWETLLASVRGFTQYFDTNTVNSFCTLPLYHVSGLMQFLRSFLTKGKLEIFSYKALKTGKRPHNNYQDYFISLVPTQLQFLLQHDSIWLSQFQTVFLGGAPAWQSLLEEARKAKIRLALTYGMTETASQIVTLQPNDFLNENKSSGRVLPHAKVTICSDVGEVLETNQTGIITVESQSLCLGYYPNFCGDRIFKTDDLGYFDEQGYLYIVGRNSQKIITGGENVFPAEIEAVILETQLVKDIAIIGIPDEKWGQVVTAIYVPKDNLSKDAIVIAINSKISKYKQPKYWISVESLPRNLQGKVNYQQLQKIALDWKKANGLFLKLDD